MNKKSELQTQFAVYCTFVEDHHIYSNRYQNLPSAREDLSGTVVDSDVTNAILVRAKPPQVELGKGEVETFKKGLDHNYPGWKLVQTISE